MNEVKSIFTSVTFWGVILSVVGKGLYAAGIDIGDTNGLAELVVSFLGDITALYGRVKAAKRIG